MSHTIHIASVARQDHANKLRIGLIAFALTWLITSLYGVWPEIFSFGGPADQGILGKLLHSPLHTSDDVMISLRSGAMLRELGLPAFNRHDLAQASTSYASPYVFALLLGFMPENLAVGVYTLLGLLAVALTLWGIVWFAQSPSTALLLGVGLLFTRTNLMYGMTGWDHLFQAMFLTLATGLILQPPKAAHPVKVLVASVSLALACAFRPDSIIIVLTLLGVLYVRSKRQPITFFVCGLLPAVSLIGLLLWLNLAQFGTLTPTTARLKLGAAPSLSYALGYFFENAALSYTALALLLVMVAAYLFFRAQWSRNHEAPIVGACVITATIAMVNSDVFQGARMIWAPACVMATLTAMSAPVLFDIESLSKRLLRRLQPAQISPSRLMVLRIVTMVFAALLLGGSLVSALKNKWREATVSAQAIAQSPTAQQYVVTNWMNTHLQPADGPIGFFYLGMSYHLPQFEAADFLGKADEMIARSKVKWGPPGHNKWDIDRTLDKWHPQAILPPEISDPHLAPLVSSAEAALSTRRSYGFAPDLLLNARISQEYAYCYVPDMGPTISDKWGFFLRKDLAAKHSDELHCKA
ncbi:MAG: hypothetical protein QM749_19275 [Aquabacterium sp.]